MIGYSMMIGGQMMNRKDNTESAPSTGSLANSLNFTKSVNVTQMPLKMIDASNKSFNEIIITNPSQDKKSAVIDEMVLSQKSGRQSGVVAQPVREADDFMRSASSIHMVKRKSFHHAVKGVLFDIE